MGHDQRWPLDFFDDVGDGERLSRAGDTQQRLMGQAGFDAVDKFGDSLGLVTGWLIGGIHF